MKILLPFLLALSLGLIARADPASHRKAAEELATLMAGPETVRAGFDISIQPMFEGMRRQGLPPAVIDEYRLALADWFDTEIKWSELQPLVASLYAEEYTEEELHAILTFVRTPAGQKLIKLAPVLMEKGAKIGEEYAKTKQASLMQRMQDIKARHQAQQAPK